MIRCACLCVVLISSCAGVVGEDAFHLFVPDNKNKRLLSYSVRDADGGLEVSQHESLSLPFGPTGIAVHAENNALLLTGNADRKTMVSAVQIQSRGKLQAIASSSLPHPSGYTSVDRSGKYFLTVNYRGGEVAVYHIESDGSIGGVACEITTPNREAHCILTTPDNRFVYIPCVKNNNALFQFAFEEATGELEPLNPFDAAPPAMFGPRHVAYHPDLPIAYFSNEQQLGVSVYEIGVEGQLAGMQHAATMPRRSPYEQGKRGLHASDLVLSPDGKLLFVAVRDFVVDEDRVFTFRIEASGKLSLISRSKVGDIPWKLDISPNGRYLLVSESGDNQISVYEIQSGGGLRSVAQIEFEVGARDMAVVAVRE